MMKLAPSPINRRRPKSNNLYTNAPTIAPLNVPTPPISTINSPVTVKPRSATLGITAGWYRACSVPATAAVKEEIIIARILKVAVLNPSIFARSSFSRMATQTRPVGDFTKLLYMTYIKTRITRAIT